ncbi:MAG: pre-peptidase C-terminal domain-containing protein [Pseudomonadota bacterium]
MELNVTGNVWYIINVLGSDSIGGGTLENTDLYFYSSSGNQNTFDDNDSAGNDANLVWQPFADGTYYLGIDAFSDSATGTYVVTINQETPEVADASADLTTGYSMVVGDRFAGEIATGGDQDWISISLTAGQTYKINAIGDTGADETLDNSDVWLYDATGNLLVYDRQSGIGLDAAIIYTAQTTGTFYIAVGGDDASATGTYTVTTATIGAADEFEDAEGDFSSTYLMDVGSTFTGTVSYERDKDWIAVSLVAGQTYQIDVPGARFGPDGLLTGASLKLFDASGSEITESVEGSNNDVSITYTAATSGTYFIEVEADVFFNTGIYNLSVNNLGLGQEGVDAPDDTSTPYSVNVGETFVGSIGTAGDEDWIAVTFEAGKTYIIDALGAQSGGGTLGDTDLRLYDANGNFIEYDDLDGAGFDAQITYTAATISTFYIEVESYFLANTGTYTLAVTESMPFPGGVGTNAELAEFLKTGTNGFAFTYDTTTSNVITVNISGLTAEGQQLALWAMEAWEMVVDLDFQIVTSGEMITVDDEDSGAFAFFPNAGSTNGAPGFNTVGVELNVSKAWLQNNGTSIDSYSFQTYVHEFGHSIGLNHMGDYNFTGTTIN